MEALAFDLGNTNCSVYYLNSDVIYLVEKTDVENLNNDFFERLCEIYKASCFILSSVNPKLNDLFTNFFQEKLHIVNFEDAFFLSNYKTMKTLGSDRICNCLGAIKLYKKNVIVFDFGTCLTAEVINPEGIFVGGFIFPGPNLLFSSMNRGTGLLPMINFERPENFSGLSTEESLKFGVYHGLTGLCKELVASVQKEYNSKFRIIATGGYPEFFKNEFSDNWEIIKDLSAIGMKEIVKKRYE
ncbi:MAG: type III pantothenate kinase [Candidatus Delongbacteria bacterium]|nr:type III pantothenate kinase [Candidatus Delongbacteria bacterium]MBN2836464.1 type III pantothenate kinase [Candidatus Delongbacteria bacterium]